MRLSMLLAAPFCICSLAASATVIDFTGVRDYTPMSTYTEHGFTVTAIHGPWYYDGYFGGGSIYAFSAGNANLSWSISIDNAGNPFTFQSVDLANDVAIADYTIEGFLGSQLQYIIAGTVPTDPIGYSILRTYGSGFGSIPITSLLFRDDYAGGGSDYAIYNDLNVDNVVLGPVSNAPSSVTPEPSSFALLGGGLLGVAGLVRKRFA